MHCRRRWQCNLSGSPGYFAQERELIERQRLQALDTGASVRRGKFDLVPAIVPKLERRRSDRESFRALDETAPIGSAAEFAIGHNFKADLLLQRDHIADALILQPNEFGLVDLPGGMLAEGVT
jgi:hypothetical protein